jgi:hypothetical protein
METVLLCLDRYVLSHAYEYLYIILTLDKLGHFIFFTYIPKMKYFCM